MDLLSREHRHRWNWFFESTWWKLTAAENEDDGLRGVYFSKMAGFCSTFSANLKLVNNTISAVRPYTMSATLLKTGCPDCIVSLGKHTIGRNMYTSVQLMSRRRRVTDAELNEFKKQAECLKLPSLAILDQEKDLCPDESYNKETGPTDLTNATNGTVTEALDMLDRFLTSQSGVQDLIKMISSGIEALKNN